MSKFKRLIAGVSAAAVVATQALTAVVYGATGLNDPEFDKAVSWMYSNGMTKYNTADGFRPYDTLTREQAAQFYSQFAIKVLGSTPSSEQPNFSDMASADPTLSGAIVTSFQLGLFKGTNGKFFPGAPLTKAQSLAVLVRAMSGSMDETVTPWWKNYFQKAREMGLTKETDVNALDRPVTRYEIALMLYRASGASSSTTGSTDIGGLLDDLLGDNGTSTTGTGSTVTSGSTSTGSTVTSNVSGKLLEVALDPATPQNQYVPGTGSQIKVMKIDLMAGSSDVTMKALTIKLEGLASKGTITNVYLVNASGSTVTSQRTFNTDYLARLVFNNGFVVPANKVVPLYVAVDLSAAANQLFQFSIPSKDSVEADVDVSGSFPIMSFTSQATSYSSQTVSFYSNHSQLYSSTAGYSSAGTLYVGDKNKEIFRFTLTTSGPNNRDVNLKTISFKGLNNLKGIIDNVQLIAGGTNVAKSVIIDGKNITVNTDYVLTYGTNKVFTMFADIVGGEGQNRDNVQLYLNNTSDIVAVETQTNAAASVAVATAGDATGLGYDGNYYTLNEGNNLISKASTSPSSSNIPQNQKDNIALIATVNYPNPIKSDKIRIFFTGTSLSTAIDTIRLYVGDKLVDEVSYSSTQYYTSTDSTNGYRYAEFAFNDYIGASTEMKVTVNTLNQATAGATISNVTIAPQSFVFGSNATYQNSNNNLTVSDINGSAVSSTYTVTAAAIQAIQRNDGLTDPSTIVAGVQGLKAMTFTVQNNNVRDLKVNGFSVAFSGTASNASYLSNLKVATGSDSSSVIQTNNFGGGNATFTSLGISVPKGGTTSITLYVDLSSGFPAGTGFQLSVANFDVQDDQGNTVAVNSTTTTGLPANSVTFTVSAGGILYVDRDTNTPKQRILAGNQNVEQEVARFKFKSTKDDSTIQELSVGNIGTSALSGWIQGNGGATSTNATVTAGADNIISALYVYDTAGNRLGSSTMVNGYAHFSFSTGVSLPRDNDVVLVVKAKVASITDASLSNKPLKLAVVNAGTSNAVGVNKTKIVSASNGNEISTINPSSTVYGNLQILRATTLTLASVAQSTSTLAGTPDIYSLTMTSDAAKQATVKEVRLDVSVTDSNSDSSIGFYIQNPQLYINNTVVNSSDVTFKYSTGACSNATGGNMIAGNTLYGNPNSFSTGASTAYCLAVVLTGQYSNGYNISAGTTATFRLQAQSVSNARSDQVSVRLNNIGSDTNQNTYAAATALVGSIVWNDNSSSVSDVLGTSFWYVDTNLDVLPLNSWTVSQS